MTKPPQPPPHHHPRVWLITATQSPIGQSVARHVLSQGDCVIAGVEDVDILHTPSSWNRTKDGSSGRGEDERLQDFREFWNEVIRKDGWKERCRGVGLDGRIMGQCQAAIAEAVATFGKLDMLFCCSSEALIGTVEELGVSTRTQTLVREQFEANFFGPVNVIKAALPAMRKRHAGHIMILSAGHLGTPGLGMYCASGWALEGFCDSLTYEIAPFDIKMTIIQPTMEIGVLTNKITTAPALPQYQSENHPAPLFRGIIGPLVERLEASSTSQPPRPPSPHNTNHQPQPPPSPSTTATITTQTPHLPPTVKTYLIAETVNAIIAIGGCKNPPARHIVGNEGVACVKEKLKTVSEELEDFVEVSCAVDIDDGGVKGEREGDGDGEGEGSEGG